MADFKVSFFQKASEDSDKKDEFLGSVIVDDNGTSNNFTLTSKAFKHCSSPNVLMADRVIIERV